MLFQDICDARNLPGTPMIDASEVFPMNWRFFPTLDPQVDAYSFLRYHVVLPYASLPYRVSPY